MTRGAGAGAIRRCERALCVTGAESRHYLYCSIFSTRLFNLNTETVHHLNVFVLFMPHFQALDIKQLFVSFGQHLPLRKLLKYRPVCTSVFQWRFGLLRMNWVALSCFPYVVIQHLARQRVSGKCKHLQKELYYFLLNLCRNGENIFQWARGLSLSLCKKLRFPVSEVGLISWSCLGE